MFIVTEYAALMNLYIFATVHSLMSYINLIDICPDHLPVQYASNIELIRQKWYWCCDWQVATPESHVQSKPLVYLIYILQYNHDLIQNKVMRFIRIFFPLNIMVHSLIDKKIIALLCWQFFA